MDEAWPGAAVESAAIVPPAAATVVNGAKAATSSAVGVSDPAASPFAADTAATVAEGVVAWPNFATLGTWLTIGKDPPGETVSVT